MCVHAHTNTNTKRYSWTSQISQSLSIFRLTFTLCFPVPLLKITLTPTSRIPSTFALSRSLVHSYPLPLYLLSPQHIVKSFPLENTYTRSFFYNFFFLAGYHITENSTNHDAIIMHEYTCTHIRNHRFFLFSLSLHNLVTEKGSLYFICSHPHSTSKYPVGLQS